MIFIERGIKNFMFGTTTIKLIARRCLICRIELKSGIYNLVFCSDLNVECQRILLFFCPLSMSMMMMYKSNNHVCIKVMTINSIQVIVSLPAQSVVSLIIGSRVSYHQSLRQPPTTFITTRGKRTKLIVLSNQNSAKYGGSHW